MHASCILMWRAVSVEHRARSQS